MTNLDDLKQSNVNLRSKPLEYESLGRSVMETFDAWQGGYVTEAQYYRDILLLCASFDKS